jgi:hypothetical protein
MNIQPFIDAWHAHNWILFAALIIGASIALAKQGWFSAWVASKLPPRAIPSYAFALALLGAAATELIAGVPLQIALLHAFAAAAAAILGHNVVIEGMRGGKELIPEAKWLNPPPAPVEAIVEKMEPPPVPPVAKMLGLAFCCLFVSCTKQQALAADQYITDFTNAICKPLEAQPEPAWVYVVCTGVQIIENGVVTILPLLQRRIPAAEAPQFLKLHAAKVDGGHE